MNDLRNQRKQSRRLAQTSRLHRPQVQVYMSGVLYVYSKRYVVTSCVYKCPLIISEDIVNKPCNTYYVYLKLRFPKWLT